MNRLWVVLWLGFLMVGCGGEDRSDPATGQDGRLTVAAVNYPLAYFAARIGGDQVEIIYPVSADVDPAFWQPSPEGVAAFQEADLVLLNGADYAKWVARVTLPGDKTVNTSVAFAERFITIADAVTHAHGPEGDHAHAGTAFTTWLDFTQAAAQAEAVRAALTARRPAAGAKFAANFASLERDLLNLDEAMGTLMKGQGDQPLVASHPVYQYLARRYGMNLRAVMWEPETMPEPDHWHELEDLLADHPARWMIWEGEPLPETAARLERLGVNSLVFDPCGNKPEKGDFLSVMQANLQALRAAFE